MDKLTAIKIKYDDGTYSDEIPVSVLSENVEWDSTHTLVDVLGSIDVDVTGTIQDQISQLFNEKVSSTQLQNYVVNQLKTDVSTWLNDNVDPVGSAVVVDESLSIEGAAADAKATGDMITKTKNELKNELMTIQDAMSEYYVKEVAISETPNRMINQNIIIANSRVANNTISVYAVQAGFKYTLKSDSYATYGEIYPAVTFKENSDVTIGLSAGSLVLHGFDAKTTINEIFLPNTDGYLLVQKNSGKGELEIYSTFIKQVATKDDLSTEVNNINEEFSKIPKERITYLEPTNNNGYLFTETRIYTYQQANLLTFPVTKNNEYHIESKSYTTRYDTYPVVVFSTSNTIVVGTYNGDIIIPAITSAQAINEIFIPEQDGYIWINHFTNSGDISVYCQTYGSEIIRPILYEKTIAILGDSIMQYMSGGYGGSNEQTFVENGNSHTYEEITITNGIPYYNGNECQVVNEKQSYYDNQGWQYLLNATQASQILNCSIGGSVLAEGTISTPYPGYEQGTHHTNSLPNLVKWLFRMCENTSDPDLVVIWMGTNGLGSADGDIDEIFALPWDTLSGDAGHTYRQTNIGALRYAIERIYREMPHTYIMVLGPIQADPARNPNRSFANLLARSNTMKNVAQRISVKFVEALTEVEVYGLIETSENKRYLVDGVHLTDAGKKLLTDFLNKKINLNYQYKY